MKFNAALFSGIILGVATSIGQAAKPSNNSSNSGSSNSGSSNSSNSSSANSGSANHGSAASAADTYNLDIAAPVQLSGSDQTSQQFTKNSLPGLVTLAEAGITGSPSALEPGKLTLAKDASVRVYFIGEKTGYRNMLGYSTTGGGITASDAALIFFNASATPSDVRTTQNPLKPGDFVDLGSYKAGTQLDFFLIANGASTVYSSNVSENADGLVHAVQYAQNGSPYLMMGWEDLFGSKDSDFADLVMALAFTSTAEAAHTISAPEPSLVIGMSLCATVFLSSRRRKESVVR